MEAYVTYRLMDDPSLNLDTLLDEYFTRLYGPAAGPMRKFYETVEQAYGNPANYPEAIATGKIEGHHHQTEEVAWGYLGNAKRMETLGKLMEEAKAAAQTAEQKQRVALFEMGIWDYMTAGRKQYLEHVKSRYGEGASMLRVPFSSRGSLQGDPAKIDAAESLALTRWRSRIAEPTRRKPAARLVHDGQYLYVQLEEQCDPASLEDRRRHRQRGLLAGAVCEPARRPGTQPAAECRGQAAAGWTADQGRDVDREEARSLHGEAWRCLWRRWALPPAGVST